MVSFAAPRMTRLLTRASLQLTLVKSFSLPTRSAFCLSWLASQRNEEGTVRSDRRMPGQSAPALVIITLAFGAVGGLMQALNWIDHGTRDRKLRVDPFDRRWVRWQPPCPIPHVELMDGLACLQHVIDGRVWEFVLQLPWPSGRAFEALG